MFSFFKSISFILGAILSIVLFQNCGASSPTSTAPPSRQSSDFEIVFASSPEDLQARNYNTFYNYESSHLYMEILNAPSRLHICIELFFDTEELEANPNLENSPAGLCQTSNPNDAKLTPGGDPQVDPRPWVVLQAGLDWDYLADDEKWVWRDNENLRAGLEPHVLLNHSFLRRARYDYYIFNPEDQELRGPFFVQIQ